MVEIRHEEIAPIDLPIRRVHYMQLLQMDHWRQDDHHPRSFPNKEICWVGETFFFDKQLAGYGSPPKAEEQVSYSQHSEEAKSA